MKAYTIEQIQNFFRTVNCMGFDDFKEMYCQSGFNNCGERWILEKYELKNTRFLEWFCEYSPEQLEQMKDAVDAIVYKRNQNPPF